MRLVQSASRIPESSPGYLFDRSESLKSLLVVSVALVGGGTTCASEWSGNLITRQGIDVCMSGTVLRTPPQVAMKYDSHQCLKVIYFRVLCSVTFTTFAPAEQKLSVRQ